MSWYIQVIKNYAKFSGRARRKEYWMFALINSIILAILAVVGIAMGMEINWLVVIYDLAVIIPSFAVSIRRMHDLDKSGFWVLISFVPLIGSIWLLVLTCTAGTLGENRYGADPKAVEFLDVA